MANPESDDHAALQARLRVVLPERIGPERWVAGTSVQHVPGALEAAEAERPPEGYGYPAG